MGYTPTRFGLFVWRQLTFSWEIFYCIITFVFDFAMSVISPEWNYVKFLSLAIVTDYSIVCSYGYRISLYDIVHLDNSIEFFLLSATFIISILVYLLGIIGGILYLLESTIRCCCCGRRIYRSRSIFS